MPKRPTKPVTVYVDQAAYAFLDKQLRSIAPKYKRGFPKTTIFEGFCKALVIALHRPDRYPLGEMLQRMYLAAIPPEDEEGKKQIESLFQ